MKKIFWYIQRANGTILLSCAITYVLGILAVDVICHAYSMIPAIFIGDFVVDMQEDIQDTARGMLIPVWSFISSIVNNTTFDVRVALFVDTIIVVVVLAIIAIVAKFLLIIEDKDKFMFALYCIIAAFQFFMVVGVYYHHAILELGIERGFWLEILSYIVFITLVGIYYGIGNMMQSENDFMN